MNRQQETSQMNFSYEGFTNKEGRRCFNFSGAKTQDAMSVFSIEVDLPLLSKVQIPVQEAPMFCLQMLNAAALAGIVFLDKLHSYRLVEEDFRSLLTERAKKAAEKACKKAPRKPFRRPSPHSNVVLGPPSQDRQLVSFA